MKLTTRIERLERLACIGEPLKLTITFFDSVLDGTISDEEFERYAPASHKILPLADHDDFAPSHPCCRNA